MYEGEERRSADKRIDRIEDNVGKLSDLCNKFGTQIEVMAQHVNNLSDAMKGHVTHDKQEHKEINEEVRKNANLLEKYKWIAIGAFVILSFVFTLTKMGYVDIHNPSHTDTTVSKEK